MLVLFVGTDSGISFASVTCGGEVCIMQSVHVLCDLCGGKAEREFEMNGRKIAVCSPGCYSLFWSREYDDWRTGQYTLKVQLTDLDLASEIERQLEVVIRRSTG